MREYVRLLWLRESHSVYVATVIAPKRPTWSRKFGIQTKTFASVYHRYYYDYYFVFFFARNRINFAVCACTDRGGSQCENEWHAFCLCRPFNPSIALILVCLQSFYLIGPNNDLCTRLHKRVFGYPNAFNPSLHSLCLSLFGDEGPVMIFLC